MKKLTGKISISRIMGGSEIDGRVHIEITDEMSGCCLLEVYISAEGYGNAVSGLSYVPCQIEYYDECPAGMKREVKTEVVPIEYGYSDEHKKKAIEEMQKFEVDGWEGRESDLFNHHCRANNGQAVTFIRFVEAPNGN